MAISENTETLRALAARLLEAPNDYEAPLLYTLLDRALIDAPGVGDYMVDVGTALHQAAEGAADDESLATMAEALGLLDTWRTTGERQIPPGYLEWLKEGRGCSPSEGAVILEALDALQSLQAEVAP